MTNGGPTWHLQPGELILRKELHDRYGGQRRIGIAPCRGSANVLLFSTPLERAWLHYENRWAEDGTFHYTGAEEVEGHIFAGLNAHIRDHVKTGKALRLFEGTRGEVRYAGEFVLDGVTPYHTYTVHKADGAAVQMIKFHLVRVERSSLVVVTDTPVGIPYHHADEDVRLEPVFAEPADPELVERNLATHRRLQNHLAEAVRRAGLEPLSPCSIDPDFDLAWYVPGGSLVICEVKSLTEVNETRKLRTGVGQLLDYLDQFLLRNLDTQGVLWVEREPSLPRWADLCRRVGIQLAWPGQEQLVLTQWS